MIAEEDKQPVHTVIKAIVLLNVKKAIDHFPMHSSDYQLCLSTVPCPPFTRLSLMKKVRADELQPIRAPVQFMLLRTSNHLENNRGGMAVSIIAEVCAAYDKASDTLFFF